jgi:putative transposase
MDDDPRLAKALARYQVISAFVAADLNRGRRRAFLEHLANRTWTGADGEPFRVSAETLRTWVRRYRKSGLDGLLDKERLRPGIHALSPEVIEIACTLKRQVPQRTLDRLIRIMEQLGHVEPGTVGRSTLHRALQDRGLSRRPPTPSSTEDLDRFEAAAPNDLWQADMLSGPFLPDPNHPGKVRRAWLYAFLDDHSRLALDGRFSFKGDMPALELSMRRAVQKWGVPRKVYYDNGQVFRAHHMRQICGYLGIDAPIHTQKYRPEGHGKIEAFNRAIRGFLAELKATTVTTIEELNEALWAWLDLEYQGQVHSETGQAPLARWKAGVDAVAYADEEKLRLAFLWSERRTPDKTGVFSLFGVRYQVGPKLARRKIEVRYDPEALHEVEIWLGNKRVQRARPLEIHPWRRPKPAEPSPPATGITKVDGDWLGHLVARHRAETRPEPDPRAWKRESDTRREENTVGLLDLLRDRLDPHVVDATEIRAWAARFGPIDLDAATVALDRLLERFPTDLHVRIYLDTLKQQESR